MQLRNNPAGLTASSIPDDVNDWGCRFVDSGQGRTTVVGAEYTHPSPRSRSHYEPEFTRIRPYIKVSPQKKWCFLGVGGGCYLVSVEYTRASKHRGGRGRLNREKNPNAAPMCWQFYLIQGLIMSCLGLSSST